MTARPPLLLLAVFFAFVPASVRAANEVSKCAATDAKCRQLEQARPRGNSTNPVGKDGTPSYIKLSDPLGEGKIGTASGDTTSDIGEVPAVGSVGKRRSETSTSDGGLQKATAVDGSGNGGMGTSASIPKDVYIGQVEKSVGTFTGRQQVIAQTVADGLIAHVNQKYPENVPAVYNDTFAPLMKNKFAELAALRELRGQVLTPAERAAERARIARKFNAELGEMQSGEAAETFATKFAEVWQRPHQGGREEPADGLPNRERLEEMLRRNPRSPGNWALDAQDKLAAGDKAGGRASLDRAISLGGSAPAFALRGGMRLDDKNYDGAYQDAKKALELDPGDKNAMGILKSAEGRASPTVKASAAALGTGGGAGGAGSAGGSYENRAGGFQTFDPGRTREIPGMTAASTLSSAQKLDEARRALAMGDLPAAIAMAQRALELNPSNASAHGFLSGVYARMGDYKKAIASANAGLALAPRDAALLNSKAFAENRSKRYRDALGSSNGAIEADARNPYSYANRAYAYGGLGDKASMLSDINRAAGIDPRFEKAAADAAALQLPSNADILFMFPGENPEPAPAAPAKGRSFGLVVGAGIVGGLLLALGLLSTVLAPLKDSVVSAFTKASRRGPSVHALEEESTPETLPEAAAPGLIRGQYEIARQIGAGGMGMVYEGTDRSLGRRVAIKKMREELRVNARERERFVIEAKTVASLHHPNIVDIYAIAEEGSDVYLVFEYVDGKTIHDLVQARGRLIPSDSLRVTRSIAVALAYAHSRGVIHRDMKPSNVMLTSAGEIKVMDFGIARMAKDALTRYSMTNNVVGTPPYMAPEQEQGVVRKESDVYALAVCSYEMMTGKLPFIGIGAGMLMNKINMSYVPPSRAIAGLPEALDEVFLKAFQADPDQRYRAPQEFAAALEAAFGGVPERA